MTTALKNKLTTFNRAIVDLIRQHEMDGLVTVAVGTRADGDTYCRSVGYGGVTFVVKQPSSDEWERQA